MVRAGRDGQDGTRFPAIAPRRRRQGTKELPTIMTSNATRVRLRLLAIVGLAMTALVAPTVASPANADGSDPRAVGTYSVKVTLRDCASGAPAAPPIDSLVTLHAGGTLSETPGGRNFAPGQRGAGHGTWSRIANDTYSQEMIALIVFDTAANLPGTPTFDPTRPVTPGFQAGWQTVSHTITFSDATHATSSGTNAFYTLAGVQYRTGCSTAVVERVR
jgi:hypothetical protein